MIIEYMAKYPTPEFSRREVNRAGAMFVNPNSTAQERDAALTIINNWRAAHNFPLNTFQMRLRDVAKRINPESLVTQRIKRLASIKHKLERFEGMNMSQIQDIGGCRAIMKNIDEVNRIADIYLHESRGIKHKLHKPDNYILFPKETGYRGIHLIYKYKSDKRQVYTDMRIEIQIRTLLQHAWATTVETVGTFINEPLKSGQGNGNWLRFFALMGSVMALAEGASTVPNTPMDINQLRREVIDLSIGLDVENRLDGYRNSINVLDSTSSDAYYYLLVLNSERRTIQISTYPQYESKTASNDYMAIEKQLSVYENAVLVTAESLESLRVAYPNYYLDTDIFLSQLRAFISSVPGKQLYLF